MSDTGSKVIVREQVETKPHVVRVPLADGTMKDYVYPTRAKNRTKTVVIVKEFSTSEDD